MKSKTAKIYGTLGVLALQVSTLPALWQALTTGEAAPISSLLLITIGLIFCMIQEIKARLWAYVIGSGVGALGHMAIVIAVLYRTH